MKRVKIELGVDPEIFAAAKQFMNDELSSQVRQFV